MICSRSYEGIKIGNGNSIVRIVSKIIKFYFTNSDFCRTKIFRAWLKQKKIGRAEKKYFVTGPDWKKRNRAKSRSKKTFRAGPSLKEKNSGRADSSWNFYVPICTFFPMNVLSDRMKKFLVLTPTVRLLLNENISRLAEKK